MLVLDGGDVTGSDHLTAGTGIEGVTVLDLTTAPPRALDRSEVVLEVDEAGRLSSRTLDGSTALGRGDLLERAAAEALARQLAPLRLSAVGRGEQPLTTELGLADLLELGDPSQWTRRGPGCPGPTGTGCGCASASSPTDGRSSWT